MWGDKHVAIVNKEKKIRIKTNIKKKTWEKRVRTF